MNKITESHENNVESSLISHSTGWDECGDYGFQFYDAELAIDIGQFKKGDKVDCFVFSPEGSVIQILTKEGELLLEKTVKLQIVE